MKKIKIAVLPGDGIGKDVTLATMPLFDVLNLPLEVIYGDIGWEYWKQEGNPIPERTWELINTCDATLLGATTSKGHKEAITELPAHLKVSPPQYISPIVQLRQHLDLYSNVRPCFNIKEDGDNFNFTIIRENTEGLYAGFDFYPLPDTIKNTINENNRWRHITATNASCSLRLQSQTGLERLFNFAFNYASEKKLHRVTFADKPNVLRNSGAFAREIFEKIAEKYPHINAEIHNIDAIALWMVKKPYEFQVIVAENMFGDILSDLGAGIMGGLGFAASANIGEKGCYFEPVHGSAPRMKENSANPSAMFLTVSLLLEHFGYNQESRQIKQAVQEVIKEHQYVTYDLGGRASTQTMASTIIERYLRPKKVKHISFLATGNEIISGDIQESNSNYFAKLIKERGGDIYQHIHVSDKKHEINNALKYLLGKSDAVVITGGLGPTSDDTTRYAIAEIVKKDLQFDESAWAHVVKRLEKFNLPIAKSNRQQALFPEGATLYPNENGTAYGAYLKWQDKHIFMLPGPPKECVPMFETYIMKKLTEENFFRNKKLYKWLTLGLIEGEIAPKIDELASLYNVELSYRWDYPYLEIKILTNDENNYDTLIKMIRSLIGSHVVSEDGKTSYEKLEQSLQTLKYKIHVIDNISNNECKNEIVHENLNFIDITTINLNEIVFYAKSSIVLNGINNYSGTITFECTGQLENKLKFYHTLKSPSRGPEILNFGKAYLAWQLSLFINSIETSL